ncbi:MAG TPA: GntR family transcriptional regulator, partial [bacterium]
MDAVLAFLEPKTLDQSVATAVYRELLSLIFTNELPPGTLLREIPLAKQLNVSRTPIREALRRLEADGLVTIAPYRGAVVTEVSLREVLECYQIREILEPAAARMATNAFPEEDITDLNRQIQTLSRHAKTADAVEKILDLDIRLHTSLAYYSKNRRLALIIANLRLRTDRVRHVVPSWRAPVQSLQEFSEIITALRRRDAAAVERGMR